MSERITPKELAEEVGKRPSDTYPLAKYFPSIQDWLTVYEAWAVHRASTSGLARKYGVSSESLGRALNRWHAKQFEDVDLYGE